MRQLLALFLGMLLLPCSHAAGWVEGSTIGVPLMGGRTPNIFVCEGCSPQPSFLYQRPRSPSLSPGQWHTIDLADGGHWRSNWDEEEHSPGLPFDTMAVFLSGLLIITHPGSGVTCDLWAVFRAPGSGLVSAQYGFQAIAGVGTKGIRSGAGRWVPVQDRKVEFYWYHTPGCPSLVNLTINAYVR